MTTTTIERTETVPQEVFETEKRVSEPCFGLTFKEDCPNEAQYKVRRTCCGAIHLFCEDCMLTLFQFVKQAAKAGEKMKCQECGETFLIRPDHFTYLGRIRT
jgi:hypothetical protein